MGEQHAAASAMSDSTSQRPSRPAERGFDVSGAGAGSKWDLGRHIRAGPEIGSPVLSTALAGPGPQTNEKSQE